ncbi:MAG: hypothetical protein J4G03_02555 [Gemmatimonadetes bacterium]|nr:hypothetical protein [Gemmatimonadota bacterium]
MTASDTSGGTPGAALSREFMDADMTRWEAYVSGGQPNTKLRARIFFVCLEDNFRRPRWTAHSSGSVPEASRALAAMSDSDLEQLLRASQALD